jgi:hypothetical protein
MDNPHQIRKIHHLGYVITSCKIGDWVAYVFVDDSAHQEPVYHTTGNSRQVVEENAEMWIERLQRKE